jgi:hypothetical protein
MDQTAIDKPTQHEHRAYVHELRGKGVLLAAQSDVEFAQNILVAPYVHEHSIQLVLNLTYVHEHSTQLHRDNCSLCVVATYVHELSAEL